MNYIYKAKKYRLAKQVKVGDIVEVLEMGAHGGSSNSALLSNKYHGAIIRVYINHCGEPGHGHQHFLLVRIPGIAEEWLCHVQNIKLIDRPAPLAPLKNSAIAQCLAGGNAVRGFKLVRLPRDPACYLVIDRQILAIISRKSVKVNMDFPESLAPLGDFAAKHKLPLDRLEHINFKMNTTAAAKPFWRLEPRADDNSKIRNYNVAILDKLRLPINEYFGVVPIVTAAFAQEPIGFGPTF